MALTLTDALAFSENELQKGVIQTIVEDSSLFQLMPFVEVQGNAYNYVVDGDLPGAAFRDINGTYTESAGEFTQKTVTLAVLGGDADVDTALVRMQGGSVADLRAEVTRQKALAVRRAFQNAFINGDDTKTPAEFEGLKNALTGGSVISAGTNGLAINGATDSARMDFIDKLHEVIAAVSGTPDALFMNRQALSKLKASAARLNMLNQGIDSFGKTVVTFDGIPLVDIGDDEAGAQIIKNNETKGSSNVATSIYAVRFDTANGVHGVTNGGVRVEDLGQIDAKPAYRTRIEFIAAVAIKANAAARLEGVLA